MRPWMQIELEIENERYPVRRCAAVLTDLLCISYLSHTEATPAVYTPNCVLSHNVTEYEFLMINLHVTHRFINADSKTNIQSDILSFVLYSDRSILLM